MELYDLTIEEAAKGIKNKEFSSADLTRAVMDRATALNPKIKAYLNLNGGTAPKKADEVGQRISEYNSPLAGVPVALKDNMTLKGSRTTAGSKILENYKPPYTATVIQKLLSAGAVIAGKTNLDEFAMGTSTENSGFYPTKNPWDESRVPGGSSGGSAAAVSAGMATYALGSDTGGSVRQPASMCGVVGLKPTYGRVRRHGLIAMCSSFDQIGPITRTVKDAGLVLNAISGFDARDSTTVKREDEDFTRGIEDGVRGLTVGVPKEFFADGLDKGVRDLVEKGIKDLEAQGAEIAAVSIPTFEYAIPVYYIIVPVEVASNLGRYDGVKYGLSVYEDAKNLLDIYLKSRDAGFGAEVKRRIILGTYVSSAGYFDAYYKKAVEVAQLMRGDFKKVFQSVDLLAGPTAPVPAFKIGEKSTDPLSLYLQDIYTAPANIAGLPSISVPAGLSGGLPVGLQLIAPWWEEAKLLRCAYAFERANEYYKLRPKI